MLFVASHWGCHHVVYGQELKLFSLKRLLVPWLQDYSVFNYSLSTVSSHAENFGLVFAGFDLPFCKIYVTVHNQSKCNLICDAHITDLGCFLPELVSLFLWIIHWTHSQEIVSIVMKAINTVVCRNQMKFHSTQLCWGRDKNTQIEPTFSK